MARRAPGTVPGAVRAPNPEEEPKADAAPESAPAPAVPHAPPPPPEASGRIRARVTGSAVYSRGRMYEPGEEGWFDPVDVEGERALPWLTRADGE